MLYKIAHQDRSVPGQFNKTVATEFSMPEELVRLLYCRGLATPEAVREFLFPRLASLPHPMTMLGMERSVKMIISACQNNIPLLVHGDYDVDGITGTALLLEFFREMGAKAHFYIPNRVEERYGLSRSSVDKLISNVKGGSGLIITVDCGISSVAEVNYVKNCGFDVIVTDHHELPSELPQADAILNPKQPGCKFGFPWLSGVGVAFYLIFGLRSRLVEMGIWRAGAAPNLKQYLDLVALGTVADVMPLVGVNRILVKAGLEVLSQKHRPGVLALCEQCGLKEGMVQSDDISFKLAPRINASGRLGNPEQGVALFTASSLFEAKERAKVLEEYNCSRKELEQAMLPEVFAQGEGQVSRGMQCLTIFQENLHPGVLGILASRVADRFLKPAIVLTRDADSGDVLKGSGRSVGDINLYSALEQCRACLGQFGGHAKAVGLSLQGKNLIEFTELLSEVVSVQGTGVQEHALEVDCCIPVQALFDSRFIRALHALQPFGEGNPEPMFLLSDQQLVQVTTVKGHLKFSIRENGRTVSGIGFNLADQESRLDSPVDLLCKIKRTSFRGKERDEIQVVHIFEQLRSNMSRVQNLT